MFKKHLSHIRLLYLLLGMAMSVHVVSAADTQRPVLYLENASSQTGSCLCTPEDMLQALLIFLSIPQENALQEKMEDEFVTLHKYARETVLRCHQICLHPNTSLWEQEQALHCLTMLSEYDIEISPEELEADRAQLQKVLSNIQEIINKKPGMQNHDLLPYLRYFFLPDYVNSIAEIRQEYYSQEVAYLIGECQVISQNLEKRNSDKDIKKKIQNLKYLTREELGEVLQQGNPTADDQANSTEENLSSFFVWLGEIVIQFVTYYTKDPNISCLELAKASSLLLDTGEHVLVNMKDSNDSDAITSMYLKLYRKHNEIVEIVEQVERKNTPLNLNNPLLRLHLTVVAKLYLSLSGAIKRNEVKDYSSSKKSIRNIVKEIMKQAAWQEEQVTDDVIEGEIQSLESLTPDKVSVEESILVHHFYNTKPIWAALSRWSMQAGSIKLEEQYNTLIEQ